MNHTSRVSPCYPYRYKKEEESDESYSQRLADELEEEILRVGEGKVAAFFAETGEPIYTLARSALMSSWWSGCGEPHPCPGILQGHPKGL